MTITLKEYFSIIESNNWQPLVVSPRPGVFFGTCGECLEWRPFATWEIFGLFELEVDKEIENIPIEVDMRGDKWFGACQPCHDADSKISNEIEEQEYQFDEDPMSLPKEVRQRIKQERREFERDMLETIQQCGGTTKTGLDCRRTVRGLCFEWRCHQHRVECPHCKFLYPQWGRECFGNIPLGHYPLRTCKDEDGVPTNFGCISCGCTFDLGTQDLVEHGRNCAIWGSGPRPGTFGAALLEDPEFLNKAAAYALEEERKHKLLQEWRKQLG